MLICEKCNIRKICRHFETYEKMYKKNIYLGCVHFQDKDEVKRIIKNLKKDKKINKEKLLKIIKEI